MKILHLIDSGGLYGAEKMLLALVKAQINQGLEPMILSASLPLESSKALDLEAQSLDLPLIQWPMKSGLNFKEGFKICRWAEKENFDLLHSHGYKFNILLGLLPMRVRRLPILATSHGYTHKKLISKMGMYSFVDRIALFFVDTAVVVTPSQSKLKLGPITKHRIVIENGIDAELVAYKEASVGQNPKILERDNAINVCAIGRLSEEKGFDLLIGAVSQLIESNYRINLYIAGEGPMRASLEEKARTLEIDKCVEFLGYISDVSSLLRRSDLFVISSYTEGLPVALLEAMREGVSIVATKVGAIPSVLEGGSLGVLVAPGNVLALQEGMMTCINRPNKETKLMIRKAKIKLKEKYSLKVMADRYLINYKNVVKKKLTDKPF